jgi:predicted DNA-binding transcriptional regulator AlpA
MAQPAPSGQPERYLAWPEVRPLFGNISRTTAWRGVRAGWLPRPVQVSPGRHAWAASDIAAWQADLQPRRINLRRDRRS